MKHLVQHIDSQPSSSDDLDGDCRYLLVDACDIARRAEHLSTENMEDLHMVIATLRKALGEIQ